MMIGIGNAKTKLGWAKNHLNTLEGELRSFCNSPESYAVSGYEDIANDKYVVSFCAPTFLPISA
jgi:hypothetical protein